MQQRVMHSSDCKKAIKEAVVLQKPLTRSMKTQATNALHRYSAMGNVYES